MSWNLLEEFVKNLSCGVRTPGSGNAKKEEDVVSRNLLFQCKYTENKNTSIKSDDIDRLLIAAKDVDKFPIFVTETKDHKILSMVFDNDNTLIRKMLKYISVLLQLNKIKNCLIDDKDNLLLTHLSKSLNVCLKEFTVINNDITNELKELQESINSKIYNKSCIDLFERENGNI